ncbi:MAG: ECF transporter S component [Candidatus Methanomethylicia archaeon]
MNARTVALTANLAAASVALRLVKHMFIGAIPIINFPAIFAIIAGAISGCVNGFIVGVLSFMVSDVFLGMGVWTIVTSLSCGIIGFMSGLLWCKRKPYILEVMVLSTILIFIYDLLSSILLYLTVMPLREAVIVGFIGLFLPAMGGTLYMIGPIVEISSATVISILIPRLRRIINEY